MEFSHNITLIMRPVYEYKCGWCEKVFRPKREDARYCSDNCRALKSYWDKKELTENNVELTKEDQKKKIQDQVELNKIKRQNTDKTALKWWPSMNEKMMKKSDLYSVFTEAIKSGKITGTEQVECWECASSSERWDRLSDLAKFEAYACEIVQHHDGIDVVQQR